MSDLVVVCGLAAEAKIAAAPGVTVIPGGGDGAKLAATLSALPLTVTHLLSFGVAGGLDPALKPGDIRVATALLYQHGRIDAEPAWAARLASALGVPGALFAGSETVVAGTREKAALRAATRAALVDMETQHVAREAQRRGIAWAGLRAVTDPADRALPHAAAVGMRPDGSIDLPAILVSLGKNPGQLPGLFHAARDARAAFAALLRCRQALGGGFARLDL
ncbi:Phosphorylase [Beijerinckiaceae bacterium RH AL1]|nr:phosphorylase [Beijerinckiaceae bacterium]VVB42333.1 Phosphorylase [Beijerinckiaceae bacterium RH AL8]VVB42334.1 Phosphorylase [Beijerinckiaceae bacterium RH CH11]VVC53256.1 Phosphorylase [Beijerinckiaceae bacterium RH AL1]